VFSVSLSCLYSASMVSFISSFAFSNSLFLLSYLFLPFGIQMLTLCHCILDICNILFFLFYRLKVFHKPQKSLSVYLDFGILELLRLRGLLEMN
jgi:hypothetical protein